MKLDRVVKLLFGVTSLGAVALWSSTLLVPYESPDVKTPSSSSSVAHHAAASGQAGLGHVASPAPMVPSHTDSKHAAVPKPHKETRGHEGRSKALDVGAPSVCVSAPTHRGDSSVSHHRPPGHQHHPRLVHQKSRLVFRARIESKQSPQILQRPGKRQK